MKYVYRIKDFELIYSFLFILHEDKLGVVRSFNYLGNGRNASFKYILQSTLIEVCGRDSQSHQFWKKPGKTTITRALKNAT